ncbi:MAG: hypothetical protein WBM17_08850, partial [Anaerolineales bacterium]
RNNTYHRTGSLFQHPFKRIPVPDRSYSINLLKYIHQNPQHHGFVKDFRDWPFSSYHTLFSVGGGESTSEIAVTPIKRKTSLEESSLESSDMSILAPLVAGDFL